MKDKVYYYEMKYGRLPQQIEHNHPSRDPNNY